MLPCSYSYSCLYYDLCLTFPNYARVVTCDDWPNVIHTTVTDLNSVPVESVEMRLLMDVGSCLRMLGGWFECLFMYNGSSLGFL